MKQMVRQDTSALDLLTVLVIKKTTIGATYVTGPYTIAISGDDQAAQELGCFCSDGKW